jgi:hypothetical protein
MSLSPRIAHLLLLVIAVAGCSRESVPSTQVIVSIDAEPNVRARTANLQIQVRGLPAVAANAWDSDQKLDADLDQLLLPYSLALVPKNGDASREYEVLVTARTAAGGPGNPARYVSVSRTLGGYRANRRLLLEVMLTDVCIGKIACPPDQTCKPSEDPIASEGWMCAPASVDPATLPEFSASMVPDASVSKPEDAGMEWTPPIPDAGEDAAVDPECPNGQCLCAESHTIECGADNGICAKGTQTCVNNRWGPCMGQVLGRQETCNSLDDDCDGNKDDNVVCNPRELTHSAEAACIDGACVSTQCEPFFGDCDSLIEGCEQPLNETAHCGSCGATCETPNAWPTCVTGTCEVADCFTDFADCDENHADCETSLYSDQHCGACDATCARDNAVTACGGPPGERLCELTTCEGAFDDCNEDLDDGCERDLDNDVHNCGACGNDCLTKANLDAASCVAGQCRFDCAGDFVDCDEEESNGCELDPQDAPCPRCFEDTSNRRLDGYPYDPAAIINFTCGTDIFNSSTGQWETTCCGRCPDVSQFPAAPATPTFWILRATSLNVAVGNTLKLNGTVPVIIAVKGSATIDGIIDASAIGAVAGAGGSSTLSCASPGGTGQDGPTTGGIVRGGGGGGFGTVGGLGGGMTSSTGGKTHGQPNLVPLRGGCSGGRGGRPAACLVTDPIPAAGAGGGAFQLSVAGKLTITVDGRLLANGGVGTDAAPCLSTPANYIAASGGGSGGAILVEASAFSLPPLGLATVAHVYGAAGGSNAAGQPGGTGATDSTTPGGNGSAASPNPGGGGGHGRVFMRSCVGP